ncbi:unnamed protein product [Effrenium voratum]|uniref:J domain-containing protein n=1 Tax=Effrenium voratum TaxID=2562239 RepID=A0AA36MHM8_9DINO|nr:unnamed protein product [Effrenium voratum]
MRTVALPVLALLLLSQRYRLFAVPPGWDEDAEELLGLKSKSENPFDILGIPQTSEQAAVRPAFRKLAATLHPDVAGTGDSAAFRKVLWAYRELSADGWRRWRRAPRGRFETPQSFGDDFEELFEEEAKMWQAVAFRGAVDKGDLEEVNEMLESGCNPNYRMPDGSNWTVLMLAAYSGHEELVQKFTKGGKGVSDKDPRSGFQALMLAAMKGHAAVCRSLLEKKAEVNAVNEDGETPLMMAAAMGHTDVVSLLLQSGGLSSVDAKDKNEMSAIKKAARWGHVDCLRLLTNGKFDDREMKHCLLFGKLYGHPEVVAEIQKVLEPAEEEPEGDAVDAGPDLDEWEEMYRRRQAEKAAQVQKSQQLLVKRIIQGTYQEQGSNHGRPIFKKSLETGESVAIYYWDEKDGADCDGWWIGAEVGGDMVFAFNVNQASMIPPLMGWRFPLRGPVDYSLRIVPGANSSQVRITFDN